jgi:CRP/FNR family transcriptional regulator, nitrogen oxide reductase regulator
MKTQSKSSDLIANSELLQNLSEDHVRTVCSAGRELRFQPHAIAVSQGHPADRLYLLTRGRARFFFLTDDGQKIILRWIVPGQIFGEAAVLYKPCCYLVGTEIVEPSSALTWERSVIRQLVGRIPQLLDNCLCTAEGYVLWYATTYESLMCHDASQRLAHLLIRLSRSIGTKVPGGVILDVKNDELANAANLSVFTVSRWMQKWQHCRAISKSRSKLLIRSPELLLNCADNVKTKTQD